MGIFDRFNKNTSNAKRSVEVISSGEGADHNQKEYSGLWSAVVGGHSEGDRELSRIKPDVDTAINNSAVAARCIDLIVDSLSARDLEVTTAEGEPVDHYLETIFNDSPNSSMSGRLFKKAIWYRIYNHGEAIIILDRGKSRVEQPKSAHLHYGKTRVRLSKPTVYSPMGDIVAFEVKINKDEWVPLAPSEVMWLREMDPANPWKSRAPMEAALESIGLSRAARGWQAGQLANGANPNGIVYLGLDPEYEEDYYLAKQTIEAALTGPSSAGRIATISGPVEPKFIQTSLNATEVAYLETLNVTDEQIANALGVPLDLVGGKRTYQNLEAAWRIFWEGTLLPKLEIIGSEINRQLLKDTNLYAKFETKTVSALQEGQDSLVNRISEAVKNDIITIDEARKKLGFQPLPKDLGTSTLTPYKNSFAGLPMDNRALDILTENRSELALESKVEVRLFEVPQYIRDNAARGLKYLEEGFGGDGLQPETIRAARRMAEGSVSEDKVKLIAPWIARHLVDLEAPKNNDSDNSEYPGPGLVAHLLWGSGPDRATANQVRRWAERQTAKYAENSERTHTRGLEPEEAKRILGRLEEQTMRVMKRLAAAQLKDAKKRLLRGERNNTFPSKSDSAFSPEAWSERAYEYLIPVITEALEKGYETTALALGVELTLDNYVINAADARTKVLVDQVNTTTSKILQDRLTEAAIADRITVQEYSSVLENTFEELSSWRAETIARTEMVSSFNGASHQAAVDSQVPVAREWMATGGPRTRASHNAMDGIRTTSMNDAYPNGLMYPGDPAGNPAETVNCRCVELYITDYSQEGYQQI
jgi:HK97 family phage portal protein